MSNSLRSRINKLAYQGHITKKDAEKIRNALGKQIPLRPSHSGITYDCPKCLETVGHITPHGRIKMNHHCKCGQAIDWSEVKVDVKCKN